MCLFEKSYLPQRDSNSPPNDEYSTVLLSCGHRRLRSSLPSGSSVLVHSLVPILLQLSKPVEYSNFDHHLLNH